MNPVLMFAFQVSLKISPINENYQTFLNKTKNVFLNAIVESESVHFPSWCA